MKSACVTPARWQLTPGGTRVTRRDAPPQLPFTSFRTHSNTASKQHSAHIQQDHHVPPRCNHPKKYFATRNYYFFVEDMGCTPLSPSRQVGRAATQGHPAVLRRERNTLVPKSPKRQGAVERDRRVHKEGLNTRPHHQRWLHLL